MKQFSLVTVFLFFSAPIINGCSEQKQNEFAGVYTSRLPRIGPLLEIMERKHKAQIEPMPVRMIYLRTDNSYVLGGCDYQIKEAGKYRITGDSIYFTNRYSLTQKTFLPDGTHYYDQKNKSIYQLEKNDDTGSTARYKDMLTIMELGYAYNHRGFLRDQEMSLDSLLDDHYEIWTLDEQIEWIHSEEKRRK
jgi:hypothetical protein